MTKVNWVHFKIVMSLPKNTHSKGASLRKHQASPHASITSGNSHLSAPIGFVNGRPSFRGSGLASITSPLACESRSASIPSSGLVSPHIRSSAYTDEREEEDTNSSISKLSQVWVGNHGATSLTSIGEKTTVNLVVTAEIFPKVKFVDRDRDLGFTENPKSICQFVIARCNLHADIIKPEWWKQVQKYVAQTINRLRNDRNTAMKWAVLGKSYFVLYYIHHRTLYLTSMFSCFINRLVSHYKFNYNSG